MDVKNAFLNGVIEKELYTEKPEGFMVHGNESHVSILKKDLYGLRQVPRAWYSSIGNYHQILGFTKTDVDSKLYYNFFKNHPLILVLYVDGFFLTGEKHQIARCKGDLT